MPQTGVIILAHGSRGERGIVEVPEALRMVTEEVKRLLPPGVEAIGAALQFNHPNLEEAVESLAVRGVDRVVIMPYFLFPGRHITEHIPQLIERLGVGEHINSLGRLTAEEMADEMQRAHVFSLNSFVENECNAMAEARTIGVPSVVSLAGGVPGQIDDGRNALGFPPGDEAVLAEQIRRIFRDDDLATRLSQAARKTVRPRHSLQSAVRRMVDIHESVIRAEQPERRQTPLEAQTGVMSDGRAQ